MTPDAMVVADHTFDLNQEIEGVVGNRHRVRRHEVLVGEILSEKYLLEIRRIKVKGLR